MPLKARRPGTAAPCIRRRGKPLSLLAFPPDSFLGRVMYEQSFTALLQHCKVEIVHESVFLAGVTRDGPGGAGHGLAAAEP